MVDAFNFSILFISYFFGFFKQRMNRTFGMPLEKSVYSRMSIKLFQFFFQKNVNKSLALINLSGIKSNVKSFWLERFFWLSFARLMASEVDNFLIGSWWIHTFIVKLHERKLHSLNCFQHLWRLLSFEIANYRPSVNISVIDAEECATIIVKTAPAMKW